MSRLSSQDTDMLAKGMHPAPFSVLGKHVIGNETTIRAFLPKAKSAILKFENGDSIPLIKTHSDGVFEATVPVPVHKYRLEGESDSERFSILDPYSFRSAIGDLDRYLLGEGNHHDLYRMLGSHVTELDGTKGVLFSVWAPNASRIGVVGEFNQWDGRCHVMRSHAHSGLWDLFIPELPEGILYKYEILDQDNNKLPLKNDPYAMYFEQPPGNASIVFDSRFVWSDKVFIDVRDNQDVLTMPISMYEVHASSWRRKPNGDPLPYRELADQLVPYVLEMGFTHIELMPITEHPFTGSWGYQPIGLFAPTSKLGSPDDFRYLVNKCHENGIGVVIDWVPAHFPSDAHGLGMFDGTHLYEHADPKQGLHKDWNTLIFNYERPEVANYLLSNALYWIREFHIDGLRVDAVASMLYLDYSREEGEWVPNELGGNENLAAIRFLKELNVLVHAEGGITFAEESTSFPGVSHPTYSGGLGFTFKWNMGWMHDTLEYMSRDPVHRRHHQNDLTFGLTYAFSENFQLPLSHDEVVYGKGSMLGKMPGDDWRKFANLRALYAHMYCYPGKKLLFMGCEFAQSAEWDHDGSLNWDRLNDARHSGMKHLLADLNAVYKNHDALHSTDCNAEGFEWISCDDAEHSVFAFSRFNSNKNCELVVVCNLTPEPLVDYRIGVNHSGQWVEMLNTDAKQYGGSGMGNTDPLIADETSWNNRAASLALTLPPLAVLILQPIAQNQNKMALLADQALNKLAQHHGIVATFYEINGREHVTSTATKKALLKANGLKLGNDAMILEALAELEAELLTRKCPREIILDSNTLNELAFEFGTSWRVTCTESQAIIAEGRIHDQISLPKLRSGIYELLVQDDDKTESITLLVAPERSPSIEDVSGASRHWGINGALYGLRSKRNTGIGDFEDLACLGEVLAANGASFIGINPVHAFGAEADHVISPYSPSHRAMLNTLHIALDKIPGLDQTKTAVTTRSMACSATDDTDQFIDYPSYKKLHSQSLEIMYERFLSKADFTIKAEFERRYSQCSTAERDFVLYETISELHGADWRGWPTKLRDKEEKSLRHVRETYQNRLAYHYWLQWVADTQLLDVSVRLRDSNMPLGLYLDLAVGSRRSGAESWCNHDVIASGVSIGAPPDQLSPAGQNWELSAFSPHQLQAQQYKALRSVLRTSMRHAGVLRLDHILGLNRSFWIPDDGSPGAYIVQPFDALMALVKIEAERSGTVIIGEDLGLVPDGFRDRIRSQGFYSYSVLQYEKNQESEIADPAHSESQLLACFGTHDTPTLQGFFKARDIEWWFKLGWLDGEQAANTRSVRAKEVESLSRFDTRASLPAESPLSNVIHTALAQSPAAMVSVQLDDVLQHIDAQNIPGTINEHPNWRRRYSIPLEELSTNWSLQEIANIMKRGKRF